MFNKFKKLVDRQDKSTVIGHFQDLEHIDGVSISAVDAGLYNHKRDDLVLFYFRNGAYHASVYTKSEIVSENIKWNYKVTSKKIKAILINTRNANAFTGQSGFKSIKEISEILADELSKKQKNDEESPVKIKPSELLFASTGTIGEKFPKNKIINAIPELVTNLKYTQNKYLWIKAAMGMLTTDTRPKLVMEQCKIGKTEINIYGVAKGSGMIYPNMATTLGFLFTDADLSSAILKKILQKNILNTFNSISCDGDTSTNDMVSIFATSEAGNKKIENINDPILSDFKIKINNALLNLAKSVVADGEGASKFITVNVIDCKNEKDAKDISFSISNSSLVKTALAGEDPNWGRIVMAIGKSKVKVDVKKIKIFFGKIKIVENGEIYEKFDENEINDYMKNNKIDITVSIGKGSKKFTAYTMDLTHDYVKINSDYRS